MRLVRRLAFSMAKLAACLSLGECLFVSNAIPPDNNTVQTRPLPSAITATTTNSPAAVKQQTTTTYSAAGSI
jgi:hypothetical protein